MRTSNHMPPAGFTSILFMWVFGLSFAVFGTLTIQYAWAIVGSSTPWLHSLVEMIAPYAQGTEAGMNSVADSMALYRATPGSMATHSLVGGFVVMLGVLQFVPALRRKYRQLHRATGALLGLFMAAVSVTGLYFLLITPMNGILAGEAFYFALFAVALLSLGLLGQSALALLNKDFRTHMVWMSLAFACFLTAPLLRFNYIAVANLDEQFFNRVVQNSSPTILVQAFVLLMLWLVAVGDKDLPANSKTSRAVLGNAGATLLACASVAGLLALVIVLLLSDTQAYFTTGYFSWVVALGAVITSKCLQISFSVQAWQCGVNGQRPPLPFTLCSVVSAVALLVLASGMQTETFYAHALFFSLVHLGIIELFILVLANSTKALGTGRHLFAMASAAFAWYWAGLPLVLGGLVAFGFAGDLALTVAIGLVPAVLVVLAVVQATGANVYWRLKA